MPDPFISIGNEGPVYVNKRGTLMYLTQCKVEKKQDLGCGIYVAEGKGDSWKATQLLQLRVNGNTVGHPTLNKDETILIFSSDLPGGYGGKDLWITVKEKRNTWSDPINLGPLVNSPGDEMFPFLTEDETIYFASNGHVGMGGFDIYKTSQDDNGAYVLPINLKSPINSSGDDFGMILERGGERGYLTSNRSGGKGGDDVYQFELLALNLFVQGIVTDSKTGAIMTGQKVSLVGSDGSNSQTTTDNTGQYSFRLKPLTSYEIIVSAEGYVTSSVKETTEGIETDKTFILDLSVDPAKKDLILPLIRFDFNKSVLRKESQTALDVLAEALLDHTDVVVQIQGHTDDVGSNSQNNRLSQKRADACRDYLITKGVDPGQLNTKALGKRKPFVIEEKDGRFKIGDVLTESYIRKIRFKKNRAKANQYNRRTSFIVISEDYNK